MFTFVIATLRTVAQDRRGVTAMEYAIMGAAIVGAVTAAVAAFAPQLTAKFAALV